MPSRKTYPVLLLLSLLPILLHGQSHLTDFQVKTDSLLQWRKDFRQVYDSALAALSDSNAFELSRVFRSSQDLLAIDEILLNQNLERSMQVTDSLHTMLDALEKQHQDKSETFRTLSTRLYYGLIVVVFLVFGLVALIISNTRKSTALRNRQALLLENERLILEYRKRVIDLQNDLNNSMTQAKTLQIENSNLQKEITKVREELNRS